MMALAGAKRACTRPDWLSVEEIDAACTEIDNVIRLLIDRERADRPGEGFRPGDSEGAPVNDRHPSRL